MNLNFILVLFAGALAQSGTQFLGKALQDLHDSNKADWEAAISGGRALVNHLKDPVQRSKTPIDDVFLNALDGAIEKSASDNEE